MQHIATAWPRHLSIFSGAAALSVTIGRNLDERVFHQLSDEDIAHYQKMVVALAGTIRIMAEIDEVIEQYGGWPGAFATQASAS